METWPESEIRAMSASDALAKASPPCNDGRGLQLSRGMRQ